MKKPPVRIRPADLKSMDPQRELAGMPPPTKAVLRAQEYRLGLDEVEVKKEAAEHRKVELIAIMRADLAAGGKPKVVFLDALGNKRSYTLETLEKLKGKKENN